MEQTDLIRRARYGPNTILAAGMSRALNTALNSAESELLLLVLILDRDSGRILDAECNIILGINSDYIASLLVGRNFYQELDEIILSIQQQYFGPGQRALIVCLKDAYSKMRARSPRSLPLRLSGGRSLALSFWKKTTVERERDFAFCTISVDKSDLFYYNSGI